MRNETAVDPSRIREEIEGLRSLTTAQLKDKYRDVFVPTGNGQRRSAMIS